VLLTDAGRAVLFGATPVRLLLPPDAPPAGRGKPVAAGSRRKQRTELPSLDPADASLFEALRARRLELARAERVPPYVIASDRTLREVAELRPRSMMNLEGIYGIGPAKAAKYGEDLLAVVRGVE
jgi:ATP-dependent DNA helicase RecQ